jgi:hypothetical protein
MVVIKTVWLFTGGCNAWGRVRQVEYRDAASLDWLTGCRPRRGPLVGRRPGPFRCKRAASCSRPFHWTVRQNAFECERRKLKLALCWL